MKDMDAQKDSRRDYDRHQIENEYAIFAGPYGRIIAARLKKYKKRCLILLCVSVVEFMIISAIVYMFVKAYLKTK